MNEHADTAKYLCTKCRRTFKRQVWLTELQSQHRRVNRNLPDATCPNCGHTAVWIGPRYRAPKASDVKTWKMIEFLESVGELALLRSGLPPQTLVITSYSIHYTKLYEGKGSPRRRQSGHMTSLICPPPCTKRLTGRLKRT